MTETTVPTVQVDPELLAAAARALDANHERADRNLAEQLRAAMRPTTEVR